MPSPPARGHPDDLRRPDFEFCVVGRPVSAQALRRPALRAWKTTVSAAAIGAWPAARPPFSGDLELRVTHYSERRIADRDNLLKPIQDALQGIAYRDDRQVTDATSNWRNINGRFVVRAMSLPLAMAFSGGDEFLHIRLWQSRGQEDLG